MGQALHLLPGEAGAGAAVIRRAEAAGVTLAAAIARTMVDPVLALVFRAECAACRGEVERPRSGPLCGRAGRRCPATLPALRVRRAALVAARGALRPLPPGPLPLRARREPRPLRGRAARGRPRAQVPRAAAGGGRAGPPPRRRGPRARGDGRGRAPRPRSPASQPPRARGFNQAALLANELARRAGIPVCEAALVRRADTPSQAGLSAAARRANVHDAFAVRRKAQVVGRAVVLVDDVYTTGATARACARALRAAGATEVRIVTVARVA